MRCELHIPLEHPASVMIDQEGIAFEIENVRTYEAGPGVTRLLEIDPLSGDATQVGGNLLPVSETNPEVHVGAENLRGTLRAAARRFDQEAAWYDPRTEGSGADNERATSSPQNRGCQPNTATAPG